MQNKQDHSFGVVPVLKTADGYKFLVVNQISHRGDRFWNFPKGHKEGGELGREAALRELEEETGIASVYLDQDWSLDIKYSFRDKELIVDKIVTYYLGYTANPTTEITIPREIAELRWCTTAEAMELLTHQNSKNLLKQVIEYLQTKD